jgi:hypothetical protein
MIGVGTSIKSGGVYLVWWAQTFPFSEIEIKLHHEPSNFAKKKNM